MLKPFVPSYTTAVLSSVFPTFPVYGNGIETTVEIDLSHFFKYIDYTYIEYTGPIGTPFTVDDSQTDQSGNLKVVNFVNQVVFPGAGHVFLEPKLIFSVLSIATNNPQPWKGLLLLTISPSGGFVLFKNNL